MPYIISKQGNRFCVKKKDGGNVPGGCHPTQEEAQKHMRALYANVNDATEKKAKGKEVSKSVKSHGDHRSTSGVQPNGSKKTDYTWKGR